MNAALAPMWDRESYAQAKTNSALNDLDRKLSMIVAARRTERWTQEQTLALQRHVLAVCLSEVAAADRMRGNEGPPAPPELLVKLRRWRLAR